MSLDSSFDDTKVIDVGSITAEFPENDDMLINNNNIPIKKLSDEFESVAKLEDSMKVYLRVRPTIDKNDSTVKIDSDTNISTCAPESSKRANYTKLEERHYVFTRVFGPESKQEDVYDIVVRPLCNRFLNGENCSLIAYGMTNAGKTHTIQGINKNIGIFPRLVNSLLERSLELNEASLQISILEIYQEKLLDLLSTKKDKDKLIIRDGNGHIEVSGLTSHLITNVSEANSYLDTASLKRTKSRTLLNAGSSRSHALYTLTLSHKVNKEIIINIFQVVDLAGAERGNRTKGTLNQQKEANNINCSLMQLWRCLNAMRKISKINNQNNNNNNQEFNRESSDYNLSRRSSTNINMISTIPFRESKLTHLLMPQLCSSGLSGVAIITCINPQSDDYDETISILNNASLACKITELADINRAPITQHHRSSSIMSEKIDNNNNNDFEKSNTTITTNTTTTTNSNLNINLNTNTTTITTGSKKRSIDITVNSNKYMRNQNSNKILLSSSNIVTSNNINNKKLISTNKLSNLINNIHTEDNVLIDEELKNNMDIEIDDRMSWNTSEIINELKADLARVKEENLELIRNQILREAEIRIEVCDEMEKRSSSLLEQLKELQDREAKQVMKINDVTRSCKKIKRKQQETENEVVQRDLKEAEEEIMRLKQMHELENEKLKQRITQLEQEVLLWKNKYEQNNNLNKTLLNTCNTLNIEIPTLIRQDSNNSLNSQNTQTSQNTQNNSNNSNNSNNPNNTNNIQNQNNATVKHQSKRTVIVQEDGTVIIPKRSKTSPSNRSPLAQIDGDSHGNSPIKLNTLKVAVKQHNKKVLSPVYIKTMDTINPMINNENIPSPKNIMIEPKSIDNISKIQNQNIVLSTTDSNMKISKQPSVMRRLRSTFRMI